MATRRNERQGLLSSPHIRMTSLRARCCSFWANPNSPSPPSNAMALDCRMHITLFSGNRTHGHARLGSTRPSKLSQNGSVWLITGNKIAGRTSVSPPRNAVRTLSLANEFLRRAEEAQRLQSRGGVHCRWLGALPRDRASLSGIRHSELGHSFARSAHNNRPADLSCSGL